MRMPLFVPAWDLCHLLPNGVFLARDAATCPRFGVVPIIAPLLTRIIKDYFGEV